MEKLKIIFYCWVLLGMLFAFGNYIYWRNFPDTEDDTKY